jgi:hypothetical protein
MAINIQFLLYVLPPIVIVALLFKTHKLSSLTERDIKILSIAGVILPWIDVIETIVGLEHEGNPFLLYWINLSPIIGWGSFILAHLLFSGLSYCLGNLGSKPEKIRYRALLVGLDIYLLILIALNAAGIYLSTVYIS